jgi:HK97 family phage major capsid protein
MRKDLKKLRQARADKAKAGKTKLEALNALLDKSDLTEAEAAQLATLEAEVDQLEKDVKDIDAEIAAEEKKARRASLFGSSALAGAAAAGGFALATIVNDLNPERTGGFHNLAEFAVSVRSALTGGGVDPRLGAAPTNFQQNQGGSGEGFLVPTDYREQIWSLVFPENDLSSLCNPEPTNSNAISIAKDETTPWGAAGVQALWRAEAGQMTPSKASLTGTLLQLHELYAFVIATSELLDDAPRLQNRLTFQAARAIKWALFEAIMFGDGNGKPLGFMNSPAIVTVAAENAQPTATLAVMNLAKMYARLLRTGGTPVWIGNPDILPQLISLVIGQQPAWLPNNQPLQGAPEGLLLGRPIYFNEHAQTLGTKGDLSIADLGGYALATKAGGGIDFAASIHLFFDYNMSAFRWTLRAGGQPYLSAPVAPAKGPNTKSHFVTLAARP